MKITTNKDLHLLIITMIISVFGALSVIGVVAAEENNFCVNNVDGMSISYKVTNDGVFKEVEVIAPINSSCGYSTEIPNGKVTIPETVVHDNIEYTVTSIGEDAFTLCSGSYIYGGHVCNGYIKNITIPDSVKCIKKNAFFDCCNLTEIDLPYNLEVIEAGAFFGTGLTAVEIPKNVTDIGKFAFACCPSLTTVISSNKEPANVDSTSFININYSPHISGNSFSQIPHYEFVYNSALKIYIPSVSKDAYVETGWPEDYLIPVYNFSL